MANDYKNDDEILGKAYDANLMKRLLHYVKPYKKYVILAILINLVVAGLQPLRPLLTKIAIDNYIAKSNYNDCFGLVLPFLLLCFSNP